MGSNLLNIWELAHCTLCKQVDGRFTSIFREVSKPPYSGLDASNRSEICQAPGQQRPRDTDISEPCTHYKIQSGGFETSWDHYNDVIMGAIAPQITSLTIVYSTLYSDADQRKHQSSGSLTFVREFPAQIASNAENVSIWWRHHVGW